MSAMLPHFVWLTVIVNLLDVLLLSMNNTVVTPTTVVKQSSLEKITGLKSYFVRVISQHLVKSLLDLQIIVQKSLE